ncbi:MAG: c-type cytochrome [Pseudomonadales bacterium]|jgi:cytochrome c5|nr:c-type cytochrome [Pseudomonadales bacterium]
MRQLGLGMMLVSLLAACDEPAPVASPALPTVAGIPDRDPDAPDADGRTTLSLWARSCALCHVDGTGGAPRFANQEDWAERRAQGEAVLLAHTLAGHRNMPPLGYCMDCTAEDFVRLIRFMVPEASP